MGQFRLLCNCQLQGHVVDSTDRFTYLGSDMHSSERSTPEILRRIGLASNMFSRLTNIWKQSRLSMHTKMRLYNALVISVLLYCSETWTLAKGDERRLEAFHMNCQRQILGIGWFHFVTNGLCHKSNWRRRNGIPDSPGATLRLWPRRLRRLRKAPPAHSALRLAVDTRAGYRPDNRPEWKRRRGRPCRAWIQQIEEDSGLNVNDAWRIAHDRKSWRAIRPVAGQAVQ